MSVQSQIKRQKLWMVAMGSCVLILMFFRDVQEICTMIFQVRLIVGSLTALPTKKLLTTSLIFIYLFER